MADLIFRRAIEKDVPAIVAMLADDVLGASREAAGPESTPKYLNAFRAIDADVNQYLLVVESNGYNDRSWLDTSGHPHSETLRITERYRRANFGHLDLEVTYDDPTVYARPWTVAVRAEIAPDTDLIEYVCELDLVLVARDISDVRRG